MKRYVVYFVASIILSLCLCIIFSGNGKAAAAGDVKIDAVNFPDQYVRAAVKKKDSDKNGVLSQEEINKVKKLSIVAQNEKTKLKYSVNLKGISIFKNATDISVDGTTVEQEEELLALPYLGKLGLSYDCKMEKLDMGKFSNIKKLYLYVTEVNEINLSQNIKLEELTLYIKNTQNMKEIDLSHNINLKTLDVSVDHPDKILSASAPNVNKYTLWTNEEKPIYIQDMLSLKKLYIKSSSKIKELHLKNYPLLDEIDIAMCGKLKNVTLTEIPNLETYTVKGNNIEEIDLRSQKKLKALEIESKNLKKLYLPTESMEVILVKSNKIKRMDLSTIEKLSYLKLDMPKLEKLSLPPKAAIEALEILNSSLKKIALPSSKKLWLLQLYSTKMKSVSLSPLKNVKQMDIGLDKAKKITIPNLKKLKTLTLRKMPKLKQLKMPKKKKWNLVEIYYCKSLKVPISRLSKVKRLRVCGNRKISTIDLRKFKRLYEFEWTEGVLKKVKWGKSKELTFINVNSNKLSGKWDLRKNLNYVHKIECYDNRLTTIIGGKYNALLYCEKNRLKKVDMRATKNLSVLSCVKNKGVRVYMPTELEDGPNVDRSAKVIYKK